MVTGFNYSPASELGPITVIKCICLSNGIVKHKIVLLGPCVRITLRS